MNICVYMYFAFTKGSKLMEEVQFEQVWVWV